MKQITVACAYKWQKKCCKMACSLTFPDTSENRIMMKPILIDLIDRCPMRQKYKGRPKFLNTNGDEWQKQGLTQLNK